MKHIKKLSIVIAILIVFMLPSFSVAQVSTPTNERQETVYNTGYWKRVQWGSNIWDPNPVFGYALIFEPLFGRNTVTDEVIPVIGTDYSWNPTGTQLIINLNPNAEFSNNQTITATDVVDSYKTAANQTRFKEDFAARVTDFVVVNPTTVRFDLNPSFPYSRRIIDLITMDIPILDKNVLDQVKTDLNAVGDYNYTGTNAGDLSLWLPNFYDPAENSAYKVYSGPYEPYYLDSMGKDERLRLRDDWWGFGEIYQDLPNAPTTADIPTSPNKTANLPKYIVS